MGIFQYIPCTLAPNALKLIKYGLCSGQRLECVGGQAAVIQGLGAQGPGLECGGGVGGGHCTDKKRRKHFLIYRKRKIIGSCGLVIYEEGMRKYLVRYGDWMLVIYDFAPDPSEFPYAGYEENVVFFFYQRRQW